MFGSIYFQIEHGDEVMVGEYVASGRLAVLGTAMQQDPSVGTTQQSGAMNMVPASGDCLGFLSQNVICNASGAVMWPNGTATGTTPPSPLAINGYASIGGPLGSAPMPQMFEQQALGYGNLPAQIGTAVSLRRCVCGLTILQVEGEPNIANYVYSGYSQLLITSGTRAITTSTAQETELTLIDGMWGAAQSGDFVKGRLKAQLSPQANSSNVRIRIATIVGYKKA